MPIDDLTALGDALRAARKEKNLTQEQLADESHVSTKQIADIEKARRNPSYLILKALAKAVHLSLDSLMYPDLTPDEAGQNEMKLLKERLSRSGITLEQHCKNSHTTPEALEKDYRAQAESRIRFVLAARAIAEAEGIVVHPEEVNAEYRRLSQLQDTPEAEIRKALAEDAVAAALAAKKVQRFLLDNAQVTTVTDAPEKE